MDMLAAWVLFPAVLGVASGGAGLLLERLAGRSLPGVLVLPAGFTLILALADLLTSVATDAALPVLAALVLTGFALGRLRVRSFRLDRWAALAAVAVFFTFGAPAALTGTPTFSGSLVLPDTSNQLVLAAQLPQSGRDYEQLPQSSFKVSATKYVSSQYPVAAQATLGLLSPLGLQDPAWLYQPFLSFMMAMAALALCGLLAATAIGRSRRAAVASIAAQPALVYSYALQGSIKEVAAVSVLAAVFALAGDAVWHRLGARGLLPVAVACAALVGVLGPAGAAYIALPALVVAGLWAWRSLRRRSWVREVAWATVVLGVTVVLTIPILEGAQTAYVVNSAVLSMAADLGNLAAPLKLWQALGVWMGGDFRYPQDYPGIGQWLAGGVGLAAIVGLVWTLRRRAVGPLLMIGTLVPVSAYLLMRGSPYADGKVLTIASPAVVLAAALGVVWVEQARGRAVSAVLAIVVAVGVLGSNALAYHSVQNAPYSRYAELLKINDRFAGSGPTLFSEYDEYSGYLLRDMRVQSQPESALGYRAPPERTPNGLADLRHRPSVKTPLDLDDLTTAFVQQQNLLVLRDSPATSRAPADFRRVFAGEYYDVWRRVRGAGAPRVLAHLPLGKDVFSPGATPRCRTIRALGRRAAKAHGRLAYVFRPLLVGTFPLNGPVPDGWFQYAGYPRAIVPSGPGRLTRTVRLFAGGRYRLWVEGSFGRAVHVSVDGAQVGSVAYQAGNPGQYFALGSTRLAPGLHRITVSRDGGDLRPGDGGGSKSSLRQIGPVLLSPVANERQRVQTLPPTRASELCGRRLDWIEIVANR